MTFADLLKDILDTSKDRVKTPILGSFFISFLLWNWRPFFLLFFENTSITNKILVINSEYCNFSSIIGPIILSFFYTLCIPYIMTIIDFLLTPAKRWRLNNVYNSKKDDLENQILLVTKELELQDKRTRNKVQEEFQSQIYELQRRIETNDNSHKAIINSYESKIAELTKRLNNITSNSGERTPRKNIKVNFLEILMSSNLSQNDFYKLHELPDSTKNKLDLVKIGYSVSNFLRKNNLIEELDDNETYLTELGLKFRNLIVDNEIYSIRDIE